MADKRVSEHLQRSIIIYSALGILVIGVIVAFVSITPLFNHLKKNADQNLSFAVKTGTLAIEEYLTRAKDVALQITSRSRIRDYLEAYNKGQISLEELVNFTAPKLADAMNLSAEVSGIARLDQKGNLVVQVGIPIPKESWPLPGQDSKEAIIRGPISVGGKPYLVVGAPILNNQSVRVGTDIVLFGLGRLQQIVQDYTGLGKTGETILGAVRDHRVEPFFPLRGGNEVPPGGFPLDSPLGSAFEKALHQEVGILKLSHPPEVIAYGPIHGSDWGLLIKMDKRELYAPITHQAVAIGGIIGILILLGTASTGLLLRPLTGRMVGLEREIQAKATALESELNERKRAEETLECQAKRLKVLRKMDQGILRTQSLESLAQAAFEDIRQLVPCAWASVMEFDFEAGEATVLTVRSNGEAKVDTGAHVSLDTFEITEDLRQGRIQIVKDTQPLSQLSPAVQLLKDEGIRSYINVPLIVQDELRGVLTLGAKEPDAFTEEQGQIAREVADQLAIAIRQVRLREAVQQRVRELEAIYEAGRRLQKLYTPETLAQEIIAVLERTLDYEYGAVLLVEEETGRLIPFALSDQGWGPAFVEADKTYVASHDIRVGIGITGWVAQTGRSLCVGDVRHDPRYHGMREEIRSELCVPLRIGDQIIGVVNIETTREGAYTAADERVLETVAAQIAIAIQNARLYERVQRDAAELEQKITKRTAELALAMERAKAADRLKSSFLAVMSHELRTPLNSILGFTGILLQGLSGPLNAEQTKQLSMVRDSARHLLDLINDVLDISKIEAGQVKIISKPFDMREAIEKVVQTVTPLAEEKNLTLTVEIGPEVGRITSDRRRVEQILINLLNNAIKFTDKGAVRVECRVNDNRLVSRVVDTGIGIKPEDMDKLFEAFRQIDTGLTRRYEGTGLGLSICKKLVEMLGGEIWAESKGLGKGSTFTFTLPME